MSGSQIGFNNGGCTSCSGGSTTAEGVVYKDVNCGTQTTAVEDKLRVVGKQGVIAITVDVWDTVGCDSDNIVRVYSYGQCVYSDGLFYFSIADMNITKPPSSKWSRGYTKCELLNPSNTASLCAALTTLQPLR